MSADSFVEAEVWSLAQTDQGNVVLVRPRSSDLVVPIFIGQLETQSILIGLGDVEVPRPLTHDLLLAVIGRLGSRLERVELSALREGTFFARLVLEVGGQTCTIDCRPSDAIGLAVRRHCPVLIAESIVEEAGISISLVTEGGKAAVRLGEDGASAAPLAPAELGGERGHLQAELEAAIEAEDYERAAILRDRIKSLEG